MSSPSAPIYSLCTDSSLPPSSLGGSTLRLLVTDAARKNREQGIDLQGILWLEHINLVVGSAPLAKYFYLEVLGLTRDEGKSFHVNLGQQQFHLAENGDLPQHFAGGGIGLVVPDLNSLRERVALAHETLKDTTFGILSDSDDCITLRGPWGNRFYIYSMQDDPELAREEPLSTPMKMANMHAEGGTYGAHRMAVRGKPGIRFVEVPCPMGKSKDVADFYREMIGCAVWETRQDKRNCAVIEVGPGVHLVFVEHSSEEIPLEAIQAMEGIHICFYVNDFAALYQRLSERNLVWTNPRFVHLDSCDTWEDALSSRTLRFKDIVDLSTGEKILELEHETRPLRHGQYLKVPKYEPM